jgi:IS30 family transposase
MELKNCSTKLKKYKHLSESERYKIEALLEARNKVDAIARILKRNRSTIYREIKRGTIVRLDYELRKKKQYRANVGQRRYQESGKNKERSLKIGKDKRLEAHIRKKILKKKYSPDAIIGEINRKGLKFEGMICTKTLYNYIDRGIFSGISNKSLWEKRKKKRGYKTVSRVSRTNRMARIITERPLAAQMREEYGHWEGDCVKGPLGTKSGLLTLTERKTLEEIIIKLKRMTQKEVRKAINRLERKYGAQFRIKFKSITFDNGVEFLDWQSLEISILEPGKQRTTTYFAHAYSSWERGSNEVQNKMIRRFIPKGTDIADISRHEIKRIENWMNNYPRKKLGYATAKEMAENCLQNDSDQKFDSVAL